MRIPGLAKGSEMLLFRSCIPDNSTTADTVGVSHRNLFGHAILCGATTSRTRMVHGPIPTPHISGERADAEELMKFLPAMPRTPFG
jgi:hypothetical protein